MNMLDTPIEERFAALKLDEALIRRSIPDRFEEQVLQRPAHVALRDEEESVTYDELNRRANRLAHGLLARGGRREEPVALMMGQNRHLITAMMACLKAGRIYAVLHPTLPPSVLRNIIDDAGVRLVVTTAEHREAVLQAGSGDVVLWEDLMGEDGSNPGLTFQPEEDSNIYFTSGSTGKAKGVTRQHIAVTQRVAAFTALNDVTAEDRFFLLSACSFGASETDVYGALLNGATLCTYDLQKQGVTGFRDAMDLYRPTVYHPPIALFRRIAHTWEHDARFDYVRLLILAGDALYPGDIERYRRHFPASCTLLHRLSATEVGAMACMWIDRDTPAFNGPAPVGYPMPGREILLLDEEGKTVPRGEPGEIVVRSPYVTAYYWNSPELTAQRFTPDPDDPRQKRYYTGDLGRFDEKGRLMHLGRKDTLIKLRGYAVNVRNIEEALMNCDDVNEAAVIVAQDDVPGDKHLVAYATLRKGSALTPSDLRERLSGRLMQWEVPSHIIIVDEFPLTPTGKIDRQTLTRRPREERPATAEKTAPRTSVEVHMLKLWQEVLKTADIGIHDNVFDLGADSLQLMGILAAVDHAFGSKYRPEVFYTHNTIHELSRLVEGEYQPMSRTSIISIRPEGRRPPLFFLHLIQGNALYCRKVLPHIDAEQPVYGIHAPLDGDLPRRFSTIEDMARCYVEQINEQFPAGPVYLAGHSFGGRVAYEMARQFESLGREVPFIGVFDITPCTEYMQGALRPVRRLGQFLLNAPVSAYESIHRRGVVGLIRYALNRLRQGPPREKTGVEEGLDDLPDAFRDVTYEYLRAIQAYAPQPIRGRVTLFRVRARPLKNPLPNDFGWGRLCGGGVDVRYIKHAMHSQLFKEPVVRRVGAELNRALSALAS